MSNSILTASAQPMSLSFSSHPGRSCHAHNLSPSTMPMPMVELALENPLTSEICLPPSISLVRRGCVRVLYHQIRLLMRCLGGWMGSCGKFPSFFQGWLGKLILKEWCGMHIVVFCIVFLCLQVCGWGTASILWWHSHISPFWVLVGIHFFFLSSMRVWQMWWFYWRECLSIFPMGFLAGWLLHLFPQSHMDMYFLAHFNHKCIKWGRWDLWWNFLHLFPVVFLLCTVGVCLSVVVLHFELQFLGYALFIHYILELDFREFWRWSHLPISGLGWGLLLTVSLLVHLQTAQRVLQMLHLQSCCLC